jgi:hypothetical protein
MLSESPLRLIHLSNRTRWAAALASAMGHEQTKGKRVVVVSQRLSPIDPAQRECWVAAAVAASLSPGCARPRISSLRYLRASAASPPLVA